mmetsp:Transcript_59589/g.167868  ORF Transcript_59589/g.167868 Transcript_59589/m.167868 type:complete len:208 (+) Transcript_59589:277-900(+)
MEGLARPGAVLGVPVRPGVDGAAGRRGVGQPPPHQAGQRAAPPRGLHPHQLEVVDERREGGHQARHPPLAVGRLPVGDIQAPHVPLAHERQRLDPARDLHRREREARGRAALVRRVEDLAVQQRRGVVHLARVHPARAAPAPGALPQHLEEHTGLQLVDVGLPLLVREELVVYPFVVFVVLLCCLGGLHHALVERAECFHHQGSEQK